MRRETAIELATRHALKVYPDISLDEYVISAPTRPDWFTEWAVYFHHNSRNAGFLILVAGGDIYNGKAVRVSVNHRW